MSARLDRATVPVLVMLNEYWTRSPASRMPLPFTSVVAADLSSVIDFVSTRTLAVDVTFVPLGGVPVAVAVFVMPFAIVTVHV